MGVLDEQRCDLCGARFLSRALDPHEIAERQRSGAEMIGAICINGHRYLFLIERRRRR